MTMRQFDYDTISDVILHLRYTAREGGGLLRNGAVANLKTRIEEAQAAGSVRLFSVRHEFPTEWAKFKRVPLLGFAIHAAELRLNLREEHYPFWSQGKLEAVKRVEAIAKNAKGEVKVYYEPNGPVKAMLTKDKSLGSLWRGQLPNLMVKQPNGEVTEKPTGQITLYFDDNSMEDIWLALAWGKEG